MKNWVHVFFQTFSICTEPWKLNQTELVWVGRPEWWDPSCRSSSGTLGFADERFTVFVLQVWSLCSDVRAAGRRPVRFICFWAAAASFRCLSAPWLCADRALSSGCTHYAAAPMQTSNAHVGLLSFISATWPKLETSSLMVASKIYVALRLDSLFLIMRL